MRRLLPTILTCAFVLVACTNGQGQSTADPPGPEASFGSARIVVAEQLLEAEVLRQLAADDPCACFKQRYPEREIDPASIDAEARQVNGEGPLPKSTGSVGNLEVAAQLLNAARIVTTAGPEPVLAWLLVPVDGRLARGLKVIAISMSDGRTVWLATDDAIELANC